MNTNIGVGARGAASPRVYVRMYRALEAVPLAERQYKGLLGDCFLIRIDQGGKQSTIVIDCGILLGSPDASGRMAQVAADIVTQCGGNLEKGVPGTLDLLVVTHPHWDHISGFVHASNVFLDPAKLCIANLWMSWAEGPDDQAEAVRAKFDASAAAFAALATRLGKEAARFGAAAAARATNGLEGFLGIAEGGRLTGRDIIEQLKKVARNTRFLDAGTVLETPGANPLRAYVLGPPRDHKFLFKDDPSAGDARETYLDAPEIDSGYILRFAAGEDPNPTLDWPFAASYCQIRAEDVSGAAASGAPRDPAIAWLWRRYFGKAPADSEAGRAMAERRVDTDWLAPLTPLAAQLDNHINNSSLALAFDLPDGGLMLFPADAQVGNWESWREQDYVDENGRSQTAAELLARTRLYKVGHHGSENATLATNGLALMLRDDLIAMIPTDEELGARQGRGGWKMPNPRVKRALIERTQGRILRNDRGYSPAERADDPDIAAVGQAFFDRLEETELYLEYQLL